MIIINSGAYVIREFQAEFGKIPPALLPLGNRRLIDYQLNALKKMASATERIVLSLPESYALSAAQREALDGMGGSLTMVPDDLSLAESVLFVLNTAGEFDESVRLLHGDTLIDDLPVDEDTIGVAVTGDDYAWEVEQTREDGDLIWCGYFSFSSVRHLMNALATSRGDFVGAVRHYQRTRPMTRRLIRQWHDLGHINTYFRSRACFTTQRAFNSLDVHDGVVLKSSDDDKKIRAEAKWFADLPVHLRKYTPQLIEQGQGLDGRYFYMLEYLPLIPLSEVFVHGKNLPVFWRRIFNLAGGFLSAGRVAAADAVETCSDNVAFRLYTVKTARRLAQYQIQSGMDLDKPVQYGVARLPSIRDIAAHCCSQAVALPLYPGVLHGDLCLSNILFDARGDMIKLIDPRGMSEDGAATSFGDRKYDVAKLAHSIIGLYDFIIAGRYQLEGTAAEGVTIAFDVDERIVQAQHVFLNHVFLADLHTRDVMPIVVLLFLSMLPLHAERPDRQDAMLANALRLYALFVGESP